MSLSFAVTISEYMKAARSPPRSEPAKCQDMRPRALNVPTHCRALPFMLLNRGLKSEVGIVVAVDQGVFSQGKAHAERGYTGNVNIVRRAEPICFGPLMGVTYSLVTPRKPIASRALSDSEGLCQDDHCGMFLRQAFVRGTAAPLAIRPEACSQPVKAIKCSIHA